MIEFMDESTGKFVGIRASGKLTDKDYKDILIPKLETLTKDQEKLDLLFFMDKDFEGWDLHAAWDDMTYGLQHVADFEKLAIVGGPKWIEWCIKACGFLFRGEIRIYPEDELEKAWEWVAG
jgi:SpoIIAA-like